MPAGQRTLTSCSRVTTSPAWSNSSTRMRSGCCGSRDARAPRVISPETRLTVQPSNLSSDSVATRLDNKEVRQFQGNANGLTTDPRPMVALVHLHAIAFSAWLVLLVVQTRLIAAHRVDMHMKLGLAGVALAVC